MFFLLDFDDCLCLQAFYLAHASFASGDLADGLPDDGQCLGIDGRGRTGCGLPFRSHRFFGGYFVDYLNQPFAQLDDNHEDDEHRNHAHHHEL